MLLTFMLAVRTRRAKIKKAPWINSELKRGMRHCDAAKRKAMALNDPRDQEKYKKLRHTINTRLLKHLIILMLLVNLKLILQKLGKPLTNLLPVAPTIQRWKNCSSMAPLFLILVSFLMLLMTTIQQLAPALPIKFLQMIIILIPVMSII